MAAQVWERAWELVQTRSAAADALFVYGVRTTGIYCRPSCPSRKPGRNAVEFFPGSESAERAGYRACKRCRPGEMHPQGQKIAAAVEHIEQTLDEPVRLKRLGELMGLSPFHVQRLFRRTLGVTPLQYQRGRRMERFREELTGQASVTDATYAAGFGSSSRLYEKAGREMGMAPATYRKGGEGAQIRYGIAQCPLGRVLVAATAAGICRVAMGDLESELEDDLRELLPRATLTRDDAGLGTILAEVVSTMTEHPTAFELPIDVRATAFQLRVWQALQAIPRGETRSYSEVARSLGNPAATRAVARACATNPVALVVPCHRVIGSGGKLTGYRWGLERKRKLLEMERQ